MRARIDLDGLDAHFADIDLDNNDEGKENEGDDSDEEGLDSADSIGKALLLVHQVCPLHLLQFSPVLTCNFRFALLLRLGPFSRSVASRLKSPLSSSSSGSVLAGLRYLHSLIGS